jgi:CelD/BcsL family acetyltransferase involved in cellulose biosynthesis/RimJ/RimL family protein N-acetyltransferase
MSIDCRRGTQAFALLKEERFRRHWATLYECCPWATAFQSYEFVSRWYQIYHEYFDPVILEKKSGDGRELQALLTLAVSRDSGRLVVAGAHQAEYHSWLALQSLGASFIEEALDELRGIFPDQVVTFRYLPPLTPREWLSPTRRWAKRCILEPYSRPLLDVREESRVKASLHKTSNKSRLNRLKRLGSVSCERISDKEELAAIFDEIIVNYDFRQGALNGLLPFQVDSLKKPFHLALMQSPSRLHATVLKLNQTIIAAHLGIYDKRTIHLGVFAYSPLHAQYSPGKLHLLMLAEQLNREGVSTFDLTPGGDWKDRFSSNHDRVYLLRVFLGRSQLIKHQMIAKCKEVAKSGVQRVGVRPRSFRETSRKLEHIGAKRFIAGVFNYIFHCCRKLLFQTNLRVYVLREADRLHIDPPQLMSRDSVRDLLAIWPYRAWDTRQDFLSRALRWLEQGRHIYTRVEAGKLVHYGCLIESQDKIVLPEVQLELSLSPASAVMLDFYTDPQARGRGLCQASLRQMIHDTVMQAGVKEILTYGLANNLPFRRAVEKVGFHHESTIPARNRPMAVFTRSMWQHRLMRSRTRT